MEKMVYKAIIRYLKKHYPGEKDKIINRAKEVLPELKAKAPDLGGRENSLANNLDMFLLFLAFYEASDHRMSGEAIDEIIADIYDRLQFLNGIMNINRPGFLKILRKYGYEELMPRMCALDHSYAKIMHAKLIRTHTVATGADSCDYWYVSDESDTAKSYTGQIL